MNDRINFGIAVALGAPTALFYLFHADKVQAFMLRIYRKNRFMGLLLGGVMVRSPYYVLVCRAAAILFLVISVLFLLSLLPSTPNR